MSATIEDLRRLNDALAADLARRSNQVLAANADRDAAIEENETLRRAMGLEQPNQPGDDAICTR